MGLANATLRWQRDLDYDLVKVTPSGTFTIEDWGAQTEYTPNDLGGRTAVVRGVPSVDLWPDLEPLDVTQGCLGQQLTALRLVVEELQGAVPVIQTVQSPLTTAHKLAGDRILDDLRSHPDLFKMGLQIIAETNARFALEAIGTGADGIFFATHGASRRLLTEGEHEQFGEPYDRIVLDRVRREAEIIIVHVHGEEIMFDEMTSYPTDGLNWHDRMTWPTLQEAQSRFPGLLVGGINEWQTLLKGPPSAIRAEIEDAIDQTGGRRYLVAPGCVMPVTTPTEHVRAAREAVNR
jgi:uroporphyrinogen decarboxylase